MSKKLLNPDEFLAELKAIKHRQEGDPETCHIEMDEILCQTLSALGYDEGIKYFRTTPKWYS